jgi:hypothetical protein
MIAAETSYVPRGSFLDMEERDARQDHLESWQRSLDLRSKKHRGVRGGWGVGVRCLGMGKVCQCAHMKSFSWFADVMYVVMGSLDEHRCSRISVIVGWTGLSKAIFAWRYVRKVLFYKSFFPKVDSPYFSVRSKGFFLQPLSNAGRDDVSGIQ